MLMYMLWLRREDRLRLSHGKLIHVKSCAMNGFVGYWNDTERLTMEFLWSRLWVTDALTANKVRVSVSVLQEQETRGMRG